MAQTLDQFVVEEIARIKAFAEYWRENNRRDPAVFPMGMADGNEGVWAEQLAVFDEEVES